LLHNGFVHAQLGPNIFNSRFRSVNSGNDHSRITRDNTDNQKNDGGNDQHREQQAAESSEGKGYDNRVLSRLR
jgi:hypothetical protein